MSQFHRHFPELAADLDPAPSVSVERPDRDAPDEIPWHTEKDVDLAVARMTNLLAQQAGAFTGYERRCRTLRDELARAGGQHVLRDLARVALGMRVTP
jgi:hypothetical protein